MVDVKKMIGFKPAPYERDFTERDAILYSLGIGFQ